MSLTASLMMTLYALDNTTNSFSACSVSAAAGGGAEKKKSCGPASAARSRQNAAARRRRRGHAAAPEPGRGAAVTSCRSETSAVQPLDELVRGVGDNSVHAQGGEAFPRSEEHTSELQSRPHLVC